MTRLHEDLLLDKSPRAPMKGLDRLTLVAVAPLTIASWSIAFGWMGALL